MLKITHINAQTKKNRKISYILYNIPFKIISESSEIFIDGSFKMCPKKYYQILNIWGYLNSKTLYIPLLYILMTSKNFITYKHIFENIKIILADNNIENNFNKKSITTDYKNLYEKT